MNDTWGYKKNDGNRKSTRTLLRLLVDLASKGMNYLLNVGPTARGVIPAARLLAGKRATVGVSQEKELTLSLPARAPDRHISVVSLDVEGEVRVARDIMQQNSGTVILPAHLARRRPGSGPRLAVDRSGIITGWTAPGGLQLSGVHLVPV